MCKKGGQAKEASPYGGSSALDLLGDWTGRRSFVLYPRGSLSGDTENPRGGVMTQEQGHRRGSFSGQGGSQLFPLTELLDQ